MNIALAHDWLTSCAGSEELLFCIHDQYPQAPIYTTIYNRSGVETNGRSSLRFNPKLIHTSWLQRIPGAKSHHQIMVPLMPWAIHWDLSKYDLVISDSSWVMKGIKAKKHIAIILTPTRWLWGFGGDNRADNILAKPLKNILRKWDLAAAQKPDILIAISKTVQKRIKEIYHRDSVVIYPPVDVDRFKIAPENEIQDYFLSVGRLVPYKKVDLLVEVFNQLGWPLKIIGSGPEEQKLKKKAEANIEFLGALSNEKRDWYYEHARAFVFPADEDFGIVPVEAMAAGRPVIAYGQGGVSETVTEGLSGLFFHGQSAKSLIVALKNFDKQKFNSADIKKSVQKYNPNIFKSKVKNIVNSNLLV